MVPGQAGRLTSCRSKGEFIGCHSLMSQSHKTAPLIVSAGIYHGVDTRYLYHNLCRYIANMVYLCDVNNCKNILLENWAALLLLVLCATAAPRRGPRQQSEVIVYGEDGRFGHQHWTSGGSMEAARAKMGGTLICRILPTTQHGTMEHTSNICTDLSKKTIFVCKPVSVSAISCP